IVMANPNLENLNVPNEGVPKEDPHHLLDYDEEEDSKMYIEEGEPEEGPVHGDQTPPPRDESSDYDSEPEAEETDDEPEAEDADDELEVEEADVEPEAEDADDELEVEEADVEPEAEGADVELEAEEPDGVPETVIGAEMVRKGAVPKPPSDDEGSERPRKTSKKSDGDEGPSDPRGSLK
nr:hypothetical protein [Tanacetum cinerariifolium]